MSLYRLIFFVLFFALAPKHHAQKDTVMQLNQKEWQEVTKGIDYTETFISPDNKKADKVKPSASSGSTFSDYKYLIYFLVLVLVGFLFVRVFNSFKINSDLSEKVVTIDSMEEIEDNLHEVNLEDLLKEALLVKNYRIALRLNFLIIIKLLSQSDKITWAKEKTNWEYYTELQDKLLADQFKEIILSFETFWYGEHPLNEYHYSLTEPVYQAMQKKLVTHE